MIGGIDHKADIDLYLEADELERLAHGTLEGVLVKIGRPKRQGTVSISVDDARKNEKGCGIGIDDKGYWSVLDGFRVDVFLGSEWYHELRERGVVGIRQGMRDGSKIHVYDRSKISGIDTLGVKNLEFYRDNREKLPADYG